MPVIPSRLSTATGDSLAIIDAHVAGSPPVWEVGNDQCGVASRDQAIAAGVTKSRLATLVRRGHWQRIHRGVYATFSGPIPRLASVWAAVIAAGTGAAVSHHTAAELAGLTDVIQLLVHVSIPATRRVSQLDGVVIHLSNRLDRARHPGPNLPRTRVEETVLDLAGSARSLDDAVGWLSAACARRLTTTSRLARALADRPRMQWRHEIEQVLSAVHAGSHSPLELRYQRDVERAHGLPCGERQAPRARLGGLSYEDVRYPACGVVIELDGQVAHSVEGTFRDLRRDNEAAVRGDVVLHFGWTDVAARPCAVAAQVLAVLRSRGWTGSPRRCRRPDCMIAKS